MNRVFGLSFRIQKQENKLFDSFCSLDIFIWIPFLYLIPWMSQIILSFLVLIVNMMQKKILTSPECFILKKSIAKTHVT